MNRVKYVDILKGFAILAVVFFHIKFTFPDAGPLIKWGVFGSLWHVPLFFLISGLFLTQKKLDNIKDFMKTKFKSLYIQGLYYFIPAVLLHNMFFVWNWYRPDVSYAGEYEHVLTLKEHIILVVKNLFLMSREPIVGAMWFLDSLLIAMVGICILNYLIRKCRSTACRGGVLLVTAISLMAFSNTLTNAYGIILPKINNSVSAMGLIILGQQLFQRGYYSYVNKYTFIVALVLLWNLSLFDGKIGLNNNGFTTCWQLIGVSISSFYALAFIAKKIEMTWIGTVFTYIGERSFCIMGLHFIGFKVCSTLLGYMTGEEYQPYSLTTPDLENNYLLVFLYLLCGVCFPLVALKLISSVKNCWRYIYD